MIRPQEAKHVCKHHGPPLSPSILPAISATVLRKSSFALTVKMYTLSCLCLVLSSCLSLTTAVPTSSNNPQKTNSNVVNQTTCNGKQYTYQQLAGYGLVPSNARDSYGDNLGGWGSSIAIDQKTWRKLKNGTYTGTLYAIPDRGWYPPTLLQPLMCRPS